MWPGEIVAAALRKELDMIAICDHNSAENVAAVMEASAATGLTVLPGLEITSKEEVHILGLFDHPEHTAGMQELVYEHLAGENNAAAFGSQVVVESDGTMRGYNHRLLIGATSLSLEQIIRAIHDHRGLAIAAHIDREGFGILGQMGFIPTGLRLDALEISSNVSLEDARAAFPDYGDYPFLQSSDAHTPDAIGTGMTPLRMEAATFDELALALWGESDRGVSYRTEGC